MTTYGNSRISVEVTGGGIGALNLDAEQKLVIFAPGDPNSGTAQTNDPTRVSGSRELESAFGSDTELEEAMRRAAGNGVPYSLMYGVMPAKQSVSGETISGGSGTLGNGPIIEDAAEITVTNTTTSTEQTVVFRYESPPDTSSLADDEVAIDPHDVEFEAGDSDDYEIDYKYYDWESAFDSATGVIQEQESGTWWIESEAESVVNDADAAVTPLRENQWKMVRVGGAAEPNATADDGTAQIAVSDYTDNLDSDSLFVFAPTREANTDFTAGGAIGGVLASAGLSDTLITETLTGVGDLVQTLNVPDQITLDEDNGVIPISDVGAPSIESNTSTSTETDWNRTYFARQLADHLILGANAIGNATRGRINNDNTTRLVENRLGDEIIDLIDQGLLEPNSDDETNWFVSATEDENDNQEINVEFGFTPEGVVKTLTYSTTINT